MKTLPVLIGLSVPVAVKAFLWPPMANCEANYDQPALSGLLLSGAMKPAYYNEIDPFAAQWLRNLIAAGHIAPGDVDERSIEDVHPQTSSHTPNAISSQASLVLRFPRRMGR
jgi:hypothetical protein